MLWIELKIPSQIHAEASVKKPDLVDSKSANMSSLTTAATMTAMIAAKMTNFHAFSRSAIRVIFLKYTEVCFPKPTLLIETAAFLSQEFIDIEVCSAFAALIIGIDLLHDILQTVDAEVLERLIRRSEERQMTRVIR